MYLYYKDSTSPPPPLPPLGLEQYDQTGWGFFSKTLLEPH